MQSQKLILEWHAKKIGDKHKMDKEMENVFLKCKIKDLEKQIEFMMLEEPLSDLEGAFREGYLYGVLNTINSPHISLDNVLDWAKSNKKIQPPGHPREGEFREDFPLQQEN